jgi:integrase
MKVPELKNDKYVIRWLQRVRARPNTKELYLTGLQFYTEFTNKNPTELIEEAKKEIRERVEVDDQSIYQYLPDFRMWLECRGRTDSKSKDDFEYITEYRPYLSEYTEDLWLLNSKPLAPLTVEARIRAIKSFYKYSSIVYIELERPNCKPMPLEENKGIPTKEEIREILKKCDTLEKAIVLVGASSGLSSNEICNLKIKDFKNSYCKDDGITTLKLRREKTNYDFVTFLTPEASQAVWDYLKWRDRPSRAVDTKTRSLRELKRKESNDDGYLFISKYISNEYLTTSNEELRKLSNDAVQNIYRNLCEDTGLSAKIGNWNNIRSHKLRKWFSNKLREAKCDPDLREFMMGHKIEGSKGNYFVDNETELKAAYIHCAPYLTIQKDLDISESPAFKLIKQQNETLILEAEKHRVERQELQELKAEQAQMKAEAEAEKQKQEEHDNDLIQTAIKIFNEQQRRREEEEEARIKVDMELNPTSQSKNGELEGVELFKDESEDEDLNSIRKKITRKDI